MKVGEKLAGVFLIFTLSISALFYFIGVQTQNRAFRQLAREHVENIKVSFHNLETLDTKMLFSALEVIIQDQNVKRVYMEKDRDKLYHYGQPLFQNLKDRYGITHFYFLLPDGRVFLRMHNNALYGDLVKRHSFQKARDTRNPAWEMELGKTAFALRTIMPYYQADTLIGYVELGEEIDHFIRILKEKRSIEFAIIAEKTYFDRDEWKSMRREGKQRDNWDDLEKHLVLTQTSEGKLAAQCFTGENAERVMRGETDPREIQSHERSFVCGGFELRDAGGRHIGAVLTLADVTDHIAIIKKANDATLRTAIIIFCVTFAVGMLISRSITKPIKEIAEAAKAVGKGDLNRRIRIRTGDEIGQLGETFNTMVEMRKLTEEALQKNEAKYRSLVESTDDSIYLVDRNYRYLYMNNKHAQRMNFSGDEYVGHAYGEFHSPKETKDFIGEVSAVFETCESGRHHHRSNRDDRDFLRTLSPVKDTTGRVIAVTVVSKDITDLKQAEERLRVLSLTDELTGLYNRRGFFTMTEQLLKLTKRQKKGLYLLYADMDNLKEINDTFGHQEGDQALIDTGNILRATYRESDIIARIGGDEFVVFPVGGTGDNVISIVARLQQNLGSHSAKETHKYKLSLSSGISFYNPESPCSIDELLRQAEKMMYEQKTLRR